MNYSELGHLGSVLHNMANLILHLLRFTRHWLCNTHMSRDACKKTRAHTYTYCMVK